MTYYVAMHAYTNKTPGFDAFQLHGRSRAAAAEINGLTRRPIGRASSKDEYQIRRFVNFSGRDCIYFSTIIAPVP